MELYWEILGFMKKLWMCNMNNDNKIMYYHEKVCSTETTYNRYDTYDFPEQLCYMTKDLSLYIKNGEHIINTKRCNKCKRIRYEELFMGYKTCKDCRKNKIKVKRSK